MNTKIEQKAVQYLTDGRVTVVEHSSKGARFEVQGSNPFDPYEVVYEKGEWVCDCPARVDRCAHVVACELVSPHRTKSVDAMPAAAQSTETKEIDALLGIL